MKLQIIALAALLAAALHAQHITGTWQGTLKAGPGELRIVMKISLEDDKLKAVMYSIDQGGQPINASSIAQDGPTIKMKVNAINGAYEGKLSADGNTISGTWEQGAPLPLNLTRATPQTEWAIPEPPPPRKLMPAEAKPQFEGATIKPAKPDGRRAFHVNPSGVLTATDISLSDLIKLAYDLHQRQIAKGPAWLETEKFDLTAKPDTPGIPSLPQQKSMIQKLLADRFQLAFHREKRELSVYALTTAKSGPKLTRSESAINVPGFGMGPGRFFVANATMADLASMLQRSLLEQPVVDQTGLGATRYNFTLKYAPDPQQLTRLPDRRARPGDPDAPPPPNDPDAPPDLFTALQQQLGLKLESTKAPVDVLVIDKAEKPSEN
jgi:uncharacterized protein (TIGR03435 family)